MTDRRLWLAQARASLEPTVDDQTRVRVSLLQHLAAATAPADVEPVDSAASDLEDAYTAAAFDTASFDTVPFDIGTPERAPLERALSGVMPPKMDVPGDGVATRFTLQRWLAGWSRVSWLSVGVMLGGVTGYQFGLSRGLSVAETKPESPLSASFEPIGTTPPRQASQAEVPSELPSEMSGDAPPEEDALPEAESLRKAVLSRSPATRTAGALPAEAASAVNDEEVFLLQRVERALRQHNARLALGLLRQLDEKSPRGRLQQERAAARVLALCLLAAPNALVEAVAFERRYPNSVHQRRIVGACRE